MSYVTRDLEAELKRLVTSPALHKNTILVEGARQVGKSCLVEHVLGSIRGKKIEANLEVDALLKSRIDSCREFAEFQDLLEDEFDFNPSHKTILFLDEAQESMMLGSFVRSMKEQWPAATVILTGSALSRLFRRSARYPVGRVAQIVVRPFSFPEFLRGMGQSGLVGRLANPEETISPVRHQKLLRYVDEYLVTGGLPEVVLTHAQGGDFGSVQRQMLASYEQDFIRLFGEDKLHIAQGCLRSVANLVGFPSKLSSVVSSPTNKVIDDIKNVFSRMESWHLILKSPQFGSSATASHNYLPKRYLFDTGLLRCLRETAVPAIDVVETLDSASRTPLRGVLENQVAGDLSSMGFDLSGWKKSPSGMEMDFVIKKGKRTIPIECKAALTIHGAHIKGLIEYLRLHRLSVGAIVSFAPFRRIETGDKTVFNIPLYMSSSLRSLGLSFPDLT